MRMAAKGPRPKAFRDLNTIVRARELASLQDELTRPAPITKKRVRPLDRCGLVSEGVDEGRRLRRHSLARGNWQALHAHAV